ncbi:thioredoxin reductase [Phytophthora boehmeriae]|uniref:Thioredoxin reductase n=1 Tax=Phytophthora boehmeriae TaxID=109152 RepID=A0A8T1WIZ0_9STRA|nr:thioredoxin reductase [Phytophthora boehmeriae]
MLTSFTSLAVIASALLLQCSTEAHQVVYVPSPTWTRANSTSTERRVLWNPLSFLENEGFTTQENFTQYQVDNNYASLRDFMDNAKYSVTDGADQACGWTDPKGIPQQIPEDGTMRTSGYTHDGPCEIYMGDKLALSYLNCHESITEQTFKLDYSACGDSCILYWYWLGVRYLKGKYSWQIYKECIPLYSGSGGTSTATTTAPATESSSTTSTAGEADTESSQNSSPTTDAPATESTDAPTTESTDEPESPATEAPSTDVTTPTPATTDKCNASRKRIRV